MEEKTVHVPNISCGHCKATIEREVGEIPGVVEVSADVESKNVRIRWQSPADWDAIAGFLDEIGYPAQG